MDERRHARSSHGSRDRRRHGSRSRSPQRPSKRSSGRSPERPSQRERDGRGRPRAVVSYGADLNKLRAKVLKARLTKSPDLADLERQLEAAMASDAAPPSHSKRPETGRSGADNVVVLPRVDSHGRLRPAAEARAESEDMSIREMARIERETEGDNAMDRALAARIAKDAAFANDLDYIDENSEQLARGSTHKTSEQQRQAAIRDYRSMEAALSGCDMCFKQTEQADGAGVLRPPEYPMVALGNRVCLMLPRREPMNDGHCLIAPIEHIAGGSLRCDDDAWDEITNFMKCLLHMFAAQGKGAVFVETVLSTQPSKAGHCTIECIPMPLDLAADAPAYFKDGLLAVGDEWSQHRKVIDTMRKAAPAAPANDNVRDQDANHQAARDAIRRGGFRNTMSAKLPYFHVWFTPHGGMGHVIEGQSRFPPWFGREVVAGMLDLPPAVYRKPRVLKETHDQRCDRAAEWKRQFGWEKFDWTAALGGGS
ncbi:Pre-mRNA-splicing factor cwf19 [Coemansia nantahalensis]|uniref:Pre-mRNA-splicing factor cwf19 n=1 Tax=Coemansia nantahalensis TaxID=2789366 RepID=A0ACC1K2U7_9FUNG|nr:Pre-mRNA-splicing factor cwf19 [Coemansia nantahalensis]